MDATETTPSTPLKVLIVGAGIGGLTAAIALRRQGHEVEIFEKSRLASETGAAVHLAPNCTVLLSRLGVFPETFDGTLYTSVKFLDTSCQPRFANSFAEARKQWQAEYFLAHRIDLHTALKQKALCSDSSGPQAKLHTSSAVVEVDCEGATITLANRSKIYGDLVIGTDGIHSRTRASVTGREHRLFTSGKCAYRWLMPTSVLLGDPQTKVFAEEPGQLVQVAGDDRRIVFYPCSNNRVMNCIAFVPTEEVGRIGKGDSGYDRCANKGKLIKHFEGFSPAVIRLLEMAPDDGVMVWDLLDMDVLPGIVNGKTALVGDAAHPFLPWMGQGAAQAVEDGCALGVLLPPGTKSQDIPARLQLYEDCRKERADRVQHYTRHRGRDPTGKDGPPQTSAEFMAATEYCISHNAWDHAESMLEALDTKGGQPCL